MLCLALLYATWSAGFLHSLSTLTGGEGSWSQALSPLHSASVTEGLLHLRAWQELERPEGHGE